jgi:hypothetical protein
VFRLLKVIAAVIVSANASKTSDFFIWISSIPAQSNYGRGKTARQPLHASSSWILDQPEQCAAEKFGGV